MRIGKLASAFVNGILVVSLAGCVNPSWLANKIVRPPRQAQSDRHFRTVANPLYSETIILPVPAPDAGTVIASVVEPADYAPEIGISYIKGQDHAGFSFDFPDLPPSSSSPELSRLEKEHPIDAWAVRVKTWVQSLKRRKPVGTVILLTGYGMDKDSLVSWAVFFADRGWRAIVVDLRGQGVSESRYLTWGIRDRGDLHRLIDLLKSRHLLVKPWIYFGVSYGAGVALMAAAGPPLPDGVIAVAPWSSVNGVVPRFAKIVGGWLAPGTSSWKWQAAEKEAGRLAGIDWSTSDPEKSVSLIASPVLYIGGMQDPIATPEVVKKLAKHTPRSTLALLPGLSHVSVAVDIPGLCATIVPWLDSKVLHGVQSRPCHVTSSSKEGKIEMKYHGGQ